MRGVQAVPDLSSAAEMLLSTFMTHFQSVVCTLPLNVRDLPAEPRALPSGNRVLPAEPRALPAGNRVPPAEPRVLLAAPVPARGVMKRRSVRRDSRQGEALAKCRWGRTSHRTWQVLLLGDETTANHRQPSSTSPHKRDACATPCPTTQHGAAGPRFGMLTHTATSNERHSKRRTRKKAWRAGWAGRRPHARTAAPATSRRAESTTSWRTAALKARIWSACKLTWNEWILCGQHIVIGSFRKLRRDAEAAVAGIEITGAFNVFVVLHESTVVLATGRACGTFALFDRITGSQLF